MVVGNGWHGAGGAPRCMVVGNGWHGAGGLRAVSVRQETCTAMVKELWHAVGSRPNVACAAVRCKGLW